MIKKRKIFEVILDIANPICVVCQSLLRQASFFERNERRGRERGAGAGMGARRSGESQFD